MKIFLCVFLSLISLSAFSQVSRNFTKKERPIYEIGAGVVSLNLPNYPGAKSRTERIIPFPWIIYRGKILRADEEGSRLKLNDHERFEIGFSGGFNFPIDSSKNSARKGMPNTDALIGIGPGFLYRIPLSSKLHRLTLGLGLRVNFSSRTNLSNISNQGYLIEPTIRYWMKPTDTSPVTLFASLSYSAADKKYGEFFYQVDSQYETSTRKAFTAKGGTVDIAASLGTSIEATKSLTIFGGFVYSNLSLAANKRSPLLEEEHNTGVVIGASWMITEKYL